MAALVKPEPRTMCKQWWNLCLVYGDQTKYYRQLYGKRKAITTLHQPDMPEKEFCQSCGHIISDNE
jgi:hypothetical protein